MGLASGTRLGPYEILDLIGAGGMGEVYKAADTRLNRVVAIKVLTAALSTDPEMKQRFEREAQAIAGLNHPHICTLHDVGRQNETDYLVMEYLEGETLAQRLESGPLPLAEALRFAGQMADALDKAHRQGVLHRDLKPSNVMLTPSGAKLLDFGLAKFKSSGPAVSVSAMPTKAELTTPGAILGTIQYMAPEQFEGIDADARSDLFAFGAILYEMLTGRKAFSGKSRALLIGAIAASEPESLSTVRPEVTPALEHVALRCLAKDPEQRWQTAHGLMVQIQWIARGGPEMALTAPAEEPQVKHDRVGLFLLGLAAVFVGALAVPSVSYLRGPGRPDAFHFTESVVGLNVANRANVAVSPDGRSIAFMAATTRGGPSALFVRPIGSLASQRFERTDDASEPFWSPDRKWVAFAIGGKLQKVSASGGPPQQLCDAADFSGGAWSPNGTIIFGSSKGLFRVSDQGGTAEALTTVKAPETGHFWPNFLPDGKHFLYLAWSGDASKRAIYAASLDDPKAVTRLMSSESNAAYAPPGYLLFHRNATLFAQRFDAKKLALTGDKPIHVADRVAFNALNGRGFFDVSQDDDGALIYFEGDPVNTGSGGRGGRGQLGNSTWAWTDRAGQNREPAIDTGIYGDMDLSPDGKLIAVTKPDMDNPGADIWIIEWQRAQNPTRLTTDPADDVNPVWSPDGKIAFTTWRKGNADIYVINANGVGGEAPLVDSAANETVEDWSKDGRYIAYLSGQDQFEDIYALPLFGERKPMPVVQGHFQKDEPQFSYDGKWIAYISDQSAAGKFEVYVQAFPEGNPKQKISINGGGQPRWRKDGKELFYVSPELNMMAVDMKLGAKIEAGIPHALFGRSFGNPNVAASVVDPLRHQIAVAPDGQRFLVRVPNRANAGGRGVRQAPATTTTGNPFANRGSGTRSGISSGLTVILHWTAALGKEGQ